MTPWPVVDSHCHLAMAEFDPDREAVVERAHRAGVEALLVVGGVDEAGGHRRAVDLASGIGALAAAGVHPHDARIADEAVWVELAALGRDGRIAAVGEIGLDYHYDLSPRPAQREVFRRQLRLARDLGLPVVVHTREAEAETVEILEAEGVAEVGGVLHCFSGSHALAERALALGLHLSFSGIVAFPKARVVQEVAAKVPLERLLVETDAPYLAPPPHRGRRNEPAYVVEVARAVAALRGIAPEQVGAASLRAFRSLFRGRGEGAGSDPGRA